MEEENKEVDNNKKEMITSPDEESPKIEPKKEEIFINIPIRTSSNEYVNDVNEYVNDVKDVKDDIRADLVNIQMNISEEEANEEKADKLLELIKDNKKKISNNLYIISCKYDIIYYRYNSISLSLLIISTIITFIEAIRLTIINYDTQFKGSEISKYISQDTISLIINCFSLSKHDFNYFKFNCEI